MRMEPLITAEREIDRQDKVILELRAEVERLKAELHAARFIPLQQRMEKLAADRDNWKAKAADEAQSHQRALDEMSALQAQPHEACNVVMADLRGLLRDARRELALTEEDHAEGMGALSHTLLERDALREALRGVLPLVLEGLQ